MIWAAWNPAARSRSLWDADADEALRLARARPVHPLVRPQRLRGVINDHVKNYNNRIIRNWCRGGGRARMQHSLPPSLPPSLSPSLSSHSCPQTNPPHWELNG